MMKSPCVSVMAGSLILAGISLTSPAATPLFEVSFNNTLTAEFAQGSKLPVAEGYIQERFLPAATGKAAKIGFWASLQRPGTLILEDRKYFYKYQADKNINQQQGSISFWIKPEDWDGKDIIPHRMFVCVRDDKEQGLSIYKMMGKPLLALYSDADGDSASVNHPIGDWKKGDWHFVVATWADGRMSLYVDGRIAGPVQRKPFSRPMTQLTIGYCGWKEEKGGSLIQDVKIFTSPLTPDDVETAYRARTATLQGDAKLVIRAGYRTPILDGVINNGEYAFAGTGFYDIQSGEYARLQARYFLSRDSHNLYVGVTSPAGTLPMTSSNRKRDSQIWEDDGVEIHLLSPNKTRYQFIINSAGAWYDSMNGNPAWNCAGLQLANTVTKDSWSMETAIPLATLGLETVDFKEWKINICRSYKKPAVVNTCMAPISRGNSYADANRFADLALDAKIPPVDLVSLGNLNNYQFAFNATVNADPADQISSRLTCVSQGATVFDDRKREPGQPGRWLTLAYANPALPQNGTIEISLDSKRHGTLYKTKLVIPTFVALTPLYVYTEIDKKTFNFVLSSVLPPSARGTLEVKFMDSANKVVKNQTLKMDAPDPELNLPVDISDLKPGDYMIQAFHNDGRGQAKQIFTEELRIPDPKPRWETHPFVLEHTVPKPWSPLKVDGQSILCDNRSYRLGESLVFDQITSLDKKLLRAPIYFSLDGKSALKNLKTMTIRNDGVEASFKQTGELGQLNLQTEIKLEFDGLVRVKLTVAPRPGQAIEVKKLSMNLPFNAEYAKLVNGDLLTNSGALSTQPWAHNLFKLFTFWVGDEEVGFNWITTNLNGWHCQDMDNSLVISGDQQVKTATFNLIDTPLILDQARTIEFAFMATPAKKYVNKFPYYDNGTLDMWGGYFWRYYGYPDPKYLLPFAPGKPNSFHYFSFCGTSPHSPDWNYWNKQWKFGQPLGGFLEDFPPNNLMERNRDHYTKGCLNSKSFAQFKTMQLEQAVNNPALNICNLYFDIATIQPCDSLDHGCGWTDDFGRPQTSFNWEGFRYQVRAARQILLKAKPAGRISMHVGNQRLQPVLSFVDCAVGGEDFVPEVGVNGNYYDVLTPEVMTAYSLPQGLVGNNFFISQFARSLMFINPGKTWDPKTPEHIWAHRHLVAYLLLHNYCSWPGVLENTMQCDLMNTFGWNLQTTFIPYWKKDSPVKIISPENKRVLASVYVNPGKALLIVLNDTKNEERVRLNLDYQKLLSKARAAKIYDYYDPTKIYNLAASPLELTMKPRESKVLIIE